MTHLNLNVARTSVQSSLIRPLFAAIIMNLTVLALGMSLGWTSPAVPDLQSREPPIGGGQTFTEEEISWLGSMPFLGGIIATVFWGRFTERFGRKMAGYGIAIPIIIGWVLILTSINPTMLMVGRFVVGFGATGSLVITPLYVSEFCEDSYRGTLGSFVQLFMGLGVVFSYLMGYLLNLVNFTIFCEVIPILFLVCFYFLPESHVYLWMKGRKTEAEASLLWFRNGNTDLVQKELLQLDTLVSSSCQESIPISSLFRYKCNMKAMSISLGLFTFQQLNGILALLTYTSVILDKSDSRFISPNAAAIVVGLTQVFASWANTFLVEKMGRKILLLISYIGMSATLFVLGIFFYLKSGGESPLPTIVPFLSLCMHVIFYCIGAAPLPYVITSEVFQSEIRPLAFSVTIFFGTSLAFVSVKIYSYLNQLFGMPGCFWTFMIFCIIATFFTIFLIPETRGKSITDVLRILNGDPVIVDTKPPRSEDQTDIKRETV